LFQGLSRFPKYTVTAICIFKRWYYN